MRVLGCFRQAHDERAGVPDGRESGFGFVICDSVSWLRTAAVPVRPDTGFDCCCVRREVAG